MREIDSRQKQSKNPTWNYYTSRETMNDFNVEDVAKNMQEFVDKFQVMKELKFEEMSSAS